MSDIIRRSKHTAFVLEILDLDEDRITVNLVNEDTQEIIQRTLDVDSVIRRLFTKRMLEGGMV